jgi:hypothetical protein
MKKLLFILMLFSISLGVIAQTRVIQNQKFGTNPQANGYTYLKFTGTSSDYLNQNQDTIQLTYFFNKETPVKYSGRIQFDVLTTADTAITYNVYGKVFSADSWTLISSAVTAPITAEASYSISNVASDAYTFTADTTSISIDSIGYHSATILQTMSSDYYRYLMIELITKGDDHTGTGVKIEEIELKLWLKE